MSKNGLNIWVDEILRPGRSGSLTQPLRIYHPKRKLVFQPSIFKGYVKLPGFISLLL